MSANVRPVRFDCQCDAKITNGTEAEDVSCKLIGRKRFGAARSFIVNIRTDVPARQPCAISANAAAFSAAVAEACARAGIRATSPGLAWTVSMRRPCVPARQCEGASCPAAAGSLPCFSRQRPNGSCPARKSSGRRGAGVTSPYGIWHANCCRGRRIRMAGTHFSS